MKLEDKDLCDICRSSNDAKAKNDFNARNNYNNNNNITINVNSIIRSILENIFTKARPTGAGRQFFTGNWYIYTI